MVQLDPMAELRRAIDVPELIADGGELRRLALRATAIVADKRKANELHERLVEALTELCVLAGLGADDHMLRSSRRDASVIADEVEAAASTRH